MIILIGKRKVRVRYLGQGEYLVADYHFSQENRELEIPERLAEYLLDTEPELFELAED